MKEHYGIDMELTQYSKLITDIPEVDILITMGCNVVCPVVPSEYTEDWGLDDPSGKSDAHFLEVMRIIDKNIQDKFKSGSL